MPSVQVRKWATDPLAIEKIAIAMISDPDCFRQQILQTIMISGCCCHCYLLQPETLLL